MSDRFKPALNLGDEVVHGLDLVLHLKLKSVLFCFRMFGAWVLDVHLEVDFTKHSLENVSSIHL